MRLLTSERVRLIGTATLGILISVGGLNFFIDNTAASVVVEKNDLSDELVYLETGILPLRVSGVIEAAASTIVYAETSGVVEQLPFLEGSQVKRGQTLAVQSAPVAAARLQLASAERELSELERSLSVELSEGKREQSTIRLYSAQELANLRGVSNDTRFEEAAATLRVKVEESVLTMTEAADYVNRNRSLFSASGLEIYRQVVADLYDGIPNYFRGAVQRGNQSGGELETLLAEIRNTDEQDLAQIQTLATLTQGHLTALTNLYLTAEPDIFDRHNDYRTESDRDLYLSKRASVLSAATSLQTAQASFAAVADSGLEDQLAQGTNVEISDLDRVMTEAQAHYAELVATQSDRVAAAGEGVVAAELSLGRPQAPFTGVVSNVHVDVGEYVMPGTPLLTLVGDGARKMEVLVPAYLLPSISVGQVLVAEGEIVGFVDRFSLVSEGGSGTVVISLTDQGLLVGTSLIGELQLEKTPDVFLVPRSHVHFDSDGVYLKYDNGYIARAKVIYDAGKDMHLQVFEKRVEALMPAASITF